MTDGKRIWRHFQRFAEYEDLRDLYKKCIPEISKFECRILDFNDELQKCQFVLRKFEEILMQKAEKTVTNALYRYIDENFEPIGNGKKAFDFAL